ncbi:hypothetical protein VPNG_07937 [Cytospora leucostoma]|uniref:Uncharacterized protein n=1 Tax=Cytospora leucostoma TaxID=1230097 RepID=A0A423WAM6_9PEZI|nr:hypothetical protein VPNG_07937 [Cytospora leucostoma]
MDLEEIPKNAPPPYRVAEQTTDFTTTTTLQAPNILMPHATILNNNFTGNQQDDATRTTATLQSIQCARPASNLRSYGSARRFPRAFNLYYRPRLGRRRDYFLASTQASEHLNEVTFHSLRRPNIAIHPGLDKSRAIATFNHSTLLRPSRAYATWLVGGHTDVRKRHVPRGWTFTAQVGRPSSGIVEKFE